MRRGDRGVRGHVPLGAVETLRWNRRRSLARHRCLRADGVLRAAGTAQTVSWAAHRTSAQVDARTSLDGPPDRPDGPAARRIPERRHADRRLVILTLVVGLSGIVGAILQHALPSMLT